MCRVHREATERVGANRLGRNGMHGRVHREGLDGTGDGNEAWHTAKRRKQTSYVRNRVLLIGRGVAYRKMEETHLCSSAYGRNEWEPTSFDGIVDGNEAWRTTERRNSLVFDRPRSKWDPVHREGSGIPQNIGNELLLELLQSKRGPVDREGCGVPHNG